jgi:hypothetical protein
VILVVGIRGADVVLEERERPGERLRRERGALTLAPGRDDPDRSPGPALPRVRDLERPDRERDEVGR